MSEKKSNPRRVTSQRVTAGRVHPGKVQTPDVYAVTPGFILETVQAAKSLINKKESLFRRASRQSERDSMPTDISGGGGEKT